VFLVGGSRRGLGVGSCLLAPAVRPAPLSARLRYPPGSAARAARDVV